MSIGFVNNSSSSSSSSFDVLNHQDVVLGPPTRNLHNALREKHFHAYNGPWWWNGQQYVIAESEVYIEEREAIKLVPGAGSPSEKNQIYLGVATVGKNHLVAEGVLSRDRELFALFEGDDEIKKIIRQQFTARVILAFNRYPHVSAALSEAVLQIGNIVKRHPRYTGKKCMAVFCCIDKESKIAWIATLGGCEANLYHKVGTTIKSVPLSYTGQSIREVKKRSLSELGLNMIKIPRMINSATVEQNKIADKAESSSSEKASTTIVEQTKTTEAESSLSESFPIELTKAPFNEIRDYIRNKKNENFKFAAFGLNNSTASVTAINIESGDFLVLASSAIKARLAEHFIVCIFSEENVSRQAMYLESYAGVVGCPPDSMDAVIVQISSSLIEREKIDDSVQERAIEASFLKMKKNAEKAIKEHRENSRDEILVYFKPSVASGWHPLERGVYPKVTLPGILNPISRTPKSELMRINQVGAESSQKPHGMNEDCFFIEERGTGCLVGVLDGHSNSNVSQRVKRLFPDTFNSYLHSLKGVRDVFNCSFEIVEDDLGDMIGGSTAVISYLDRSRWLIYTATLGDSEANIYRYIENKGKRKMVSIALSCVRDWNHPKEKARAEKFKRVVQESNPAKPAYNLGNASLKRRVEAINVSRAFGDKDCDFIGKKPKITVQSLERGDFIIWTSDGMKDFVPENEIVSICETYERCLEQSNEAKNFFRKLHGIFIFSYTNWKLTPNNRDVYEGFKNFKAASFAVLEESKFEIEDEYKKDLREYHKAQFNLLSKFLTIVSNVNFDQESSDLDDCNQIYTKCNQGNNFFSPEALRKISSSSASSSSASSSSASLSSASLSSASSSRGCPIRESWPVASSSIAPSSIVPPVIVPPSKVFVPSIEEFKQLFSTYDLKNEVTLGGNPSPSEVEFLSMFKNYFDSYKPNLIQTLIRHARNIRESYDDITVVVFKIS